MLDVGSLFLVTSSIFFNHLQSVTGELVDNSALEFACWDLSLKEDVHFTIGTAFWLRKTEVGPCKAEEADASPEL